MPKKMLFACAFVALVGACKSPASTSEPTDAKSAEVTTTELSVADTAAALQSKQAIAVDANDAETRQKYGVVPGAVLLSSHDDYALTELPKEKDQPLIFYCGGTRCRASDAAARRARSSGYAKVSVMREGIRGWAAAGQPTTSLPKS